MHRGMIALLATIVVSVPVTAQDRPKAEVFGGYSFERIAPCGESGGGCNFESHLGPVTTNFNGWNASVTGYFTKSWGVTADLAGHYGTSKLAFQSGSGVSSSAYTYMFGPVYAFHRKGATPFIHGLVGGVSRGHSTFNLLNYNAFAWAAGGGVDFTISPRVAVRIAQFDYEGYRVPRGSASSLASGLRYSMGIVFKF